MAKQFIRFFHDGDIQNYNTLSKPHHKTSRTTAPSLHRITLLVLFALQIQSSIAQCPNMCSRHGTCTSSGQCTCAHGFHGADCSQRSCPLGKAFSDVAHDVDSAHQEVECSGRGDCDAGRGICHCMTGFTGIACERTTCKDNCNNHGICMSLQQYASTKLNTNSQRYRYDTIWDANKLYGCICDYGYSGYDCSIRTCPTGDDPLTLGGDQEVQLLYCFASEGSLVLYYGGLPSSTLSVDATTNDVKKALERIMLIGKVSVSFSEGDTLCRDDAIKNIVSVTFLDNFGPLPPLVAEIHNMNSGAYVEVAADDTTSKMTDSYGVDHFAIKGDKENDECSNRGICDQGTGTCKCFNTNGDKYAGSDGYGNSGDRGDCGYAVSTISNCPGVGNNHCSNRGVCDLSTKRCACEEGFTGGDCSLRVCEYGWSWFSYPSGDNVGHDEWVECSDMGTCDRRVGQCRCNDGFFGSACEYMGCGGIENKCSGHGKCLSMSTLATLKIDDNGVASPTTYGTDPNEPTTWDANRVFGCYCDEGHEGYDCSKRSCAMGLDVQSGTSEVALCSNHGVCNYETGKCDCFRGWGNSNGSGSAGSINDCGHRLPLSYLRQPFPWEL